MFTPFGSLAAGSRSREVDDDMLVSGLRDSGAVPPVHQTASRHHIRDASFAYTAVPVLIAILCHHLHQAARTRLNAALYAQYHIILQKKEKRQYTLNVPLCYQGFLAYKQCF